MKISGFSMAKNAAKLYYPVKESVMSILPIVDEFIFALGDCDEDDNTRELLESINSDKIKIVDTVWDTVKNIKGSEYARQTDIAKEQCTGDWLFYLQADEVVHEKDIPVIKNRCKELLNDKEVEGLLFNYLHFWGDYNHYHISHGWYKNEIRIIRNIPETHSWQDAQSFRKIPEFDASLYLKKEGTQKLKVARSGANIYHYGWVRPPSMMKIRNTTFNIYYHGKKAIEERKENEKYKLELFDYGPLNSLPEFKQNHPKIMASKIKDFYWKNELQYHGKINKQRVKHKHEKFKNRIITCFERIIGKPLFEFENYILLKNR